MPPALPPPNKKKKKKRNPSRIQIQVLEYSDSDIPTFVTELQFLLIGLPLPKEGVSVRSVKTNYIRAEGGDLMIGVIH